MKRAHIFNPEHDYSLASHRYFYTPPSSVVKLRNALSLIPALWATEGDDILIRNPEDKKQFEKLSLLHYKGIRLSMLNDFDSNAIVTPWGWDRAIKHEIATISKADYENLPSDKSLEYIRGLSHRKTTIRLYKYLSDISDDSDFTEFIPIEINNLEEAKELYHRERNCFFKAPWSSSGRGLLRCDDLEWDKHIAPWIHGIIRHQGSVLWERGSKKVLDFASEWYFRKGKAEYLGISIFEASGRGKYHGNYLTPQEKALEIVESRTLQFTDKFIRMQREALEAVIESHYEGPAGIDMLVDEDGKLRPCIEINFRNTMGHVAITLQKQLAERDMTFRKAVNEFCDYFPGITQIFINNG